MYGIELTPEHPVEQIVDFARQAEEEQFDAALVSSHYFNRDPFATLARIATETETIDIGPAAANPYEVHPVSMASNLATLQEISDGRAVFGIGPGDQSALNSLGISRDRPLRRVLESFKVARDLWNGERVSIDSTFHAADAGLEYDVSGTIPVYIGAQGPHMIRMSAKHADGLLLNASHPDDVAWAAQRVEEGLSDRPDDAGQFDFSVYASVSISENREEAREAARPPVAFIAADAPDPVLNRHGIDPENANNIGDAIERGDFTAAFDSVTPAMIDAFAAAGTIDDVSEQFSNILEYADGIVVGTPLGPDIMNAISLSKTALDRAIPSGLDQ
ncbi:5,10-methylenetetrahydromethanopterin reductase [Salinarchaeum sp. IM2453]|uniref:5,10-methylenetetrahydromethanopterin reductase n=1 Tax=Salinarchaeum sp. IM2453 TaxID=2862870 RepID=UPI001C834DC8|nr:5,10-methylenetetrahydromethanopterin reductase [Salinarchaeum sp. IM2453]QZA89462.1 5,10-methylenetetrahydromethanopterin reductase [Salinarchaeum sp. IM2453]